MYITLDEAPGFRMTFLTIQKFMEMQSLGLASLCLGGYHNLAVLYFGEFIKIKWLENKQPQKQEFYPISSNKEKDLEAVRGLLRVSCWHQFSHNNIASLSWQEW